MAGSSFRIKVFLPQPPLSPPPVAILRRVPAHHTFHAGIFLPHFTAFRNWTSSTQLLTLRHPLPPRMQSFRRFSPRVQKAAGVFVFVYLKVSKENVRDSVATKAQLSILISRRQRTTRRQTATRGDRVEDVVTWGAEAVRL